MRPGTDEIFTCPNCKNLVSRETLLSGNTFGAEFYSDGKRVAPMMPEFPFITICKKCNHIFWLDKDNKIEPDEILDPLNNNQNISDRAVFLTIDEYFLALKNNAFRNEGDEFLIRLRIWWAFNDRVRKNEELFKTEDDRDLWDLNANKLLEMFDENITEQKIMSAEIYRCKGEFNKCMEIMNSIEDDRLQWLKKLFEKECANQNVKVFKISE